MLNSNFNDYFYQDFLYRNLPIKNGKFEYELKYAKSYEDYYDISVPNNIFDFNGKKRQISLDYLMSITEELEWDKLCSKIREIDYILIIDDVPLENETLEKYKLLFLKVYQYNISLVCENVYISIL